MKKILAAFFAMAMSATMMAQEAQPTIENSEENGVQLESLSLTLGVSARKFHDPKMRTSQSESFENKLYVNGTLQEFNNETAASAFTQRNYPISSNINYAGTVNRYVAPRPLTFASYSGASITKDGSYADGECIAPSIGVKLGFWQQDALTLSLVSNLHFYTLDTKIRGNDVGTLTAYDRYVGYSATGNYTVSPAEPMSATAAPNATSTVRSKFEMDLYIIDAGVSLGYDFPLGIRAYLSAGLTFNFADMESRSETSVTSGADSISTSRDTENQKEAALGYFVAAGANYWFSEMYGLSLEWRYDDAFRNVGTKFADQSLESGTAALKLDFRF